MLNSVKNTMSEILTRLLASGAMAILIVMIGATAAFAQTPPSNFDPGSLWDFFGTEHGDAYSSVFLNQLFGPLFPSATGPGVTSVFPLIIGYFNSIILLIGGLMFFYNVTIGVMQSAHEGQILGQRWSSLWAPLRIVFAVGMLVPVNEGYNLAQTGVAYIVKGSTKMASAVWANSANLVLSGDVPIAAAQGNVSPEVIHSMYINASCMVALQAESATADPTAVINYSSDKTAYKATPTQGPRYVPGDQYQIQDSIAFHNEGQVTYHSAIRRGGNVSSMDICGSYRTPPLPEYIKQQIEEASGDRTITDPDAIRTAFIEGHEKIMSDIHASMMTLAQEVYLQVDNVQNPDLPDISDKIASIHRTANTDVHALNTSLRDDYKTKNKLRDILNDRISGGQQCTSGITSDSDSRDDERAAASNCYGEGWMGAGSWYILMARLNNELSSLMSATSEVSKASYDSSNFGTTRNLFFGRSDVLDLNNGSSMSEISTNLDHLERTFIESSARLAALGYQIPTEIMAQLTTDVDARGLLDGKLKPYLLSATKGIMNWMDPGRGGQDPMVGLIDTGTWLLAVGTAILGIVTASGLLGFFGGDAIAINLAIMVLPAYSVFLTAGVSLTFILPIMPFFYWVLAVSGYFLLIFEAIVAVNLWALSHLRMDGEGLSGESGRQGWLMILALFMTPTLMVFGFLAGMGIFRVVSDLISAGMFYAVAGIIGSSILTWMYGLVGYGILIVVAYIFLLERSFSLVSEFPNRVMRWMGASVEIGGGEDRIRASGAIAAVGVNQVGNAMEKGAANVGRDANGNSKLGGAAGKLNDLTSRGRSQKGTNGSPPETPKGNE